MKAWTNAELVELSISATANGLVAHDFEAFPILHDVNDRGDDVTPDPKDPVEDEKSGF